MYLSSLAVWKSGRGPGIFSHVSDVRIEKVVALTLHDKYSSHSVCATRTPVYRGQLETFLPGSRSKVQILVGSQCLISSEFMMFRSKTEESEKADSCWEYEPGHLACAASALPQR